LKKQSIRFPRIIAPIDCLKSDTFTERFSDIASTNHCSQHTSFMGSTIFSITLDEILEKRSFENFQAIIGLKDGEWYYCLHPVEQIVSEEDALLIESTLARLPDIIEIEVSELLKDQKLARELIKNAVIPLLPDLDSTRRSVAADLISRYSVGFGILEILLEDPLIEDLLVSSPTSINKICVATRLSDGTARSIFCRTNLAISEDQLISLVTKARIFQGGELSATKPILEIEVPFLKARLSALGKPASPHGICISIRRRADHLWTLPRLIALNSISWSAAGFLSLCCAARASIVIAGGRGSGKTTLLSSLLPEMPNFGRILVMEDTEELPILQLQREGLVIQSLSLDGGIERAIAVMRAALRMGDGPMVIGEIRGDEARILFESIRTGTANSCVLGTLHASDPETVRDRIVLDMGLNVQSFEAIDLIVLIQQRKDPLSGTFRRNISEIDLVDPHNEGKYIRPIFRTDNFGNCIACVSEFKDLASIGQKFATYLGVDVRHALRAARTKGFIKNIQVQEWLKTREDNFLSVGATKAINNIPIDFANSPDLPYLKSAVLERLQEVI